MQTILSAINDFGHDVVFRWPVGLDWTSAAENGLFDDIDLVLVNGEGSIHNSATRHRTRQLCKLGPFAARELGVPVHLVNSTIAALDKAALNDLRHFSSISVRETVSCRYLQDYGLKSEVVPDLSLGHAAPPVEERKAVLVTDSIVDPAAHVLEETAERISGRFISFQKKKRSLLEKLTFRGKANTPIKGANLPRALERDLDRILRDFSGCQVLLTGRFHAFCLAILSRTPVIAVESNTHKIGAMAMDVFGSSDRVVESETATVESLVAMVPVAGFSELETQAIEAFLEKASMARCQMWERILA